MSRLPPHLQNKFVLTLVIAARARQLVQDAERTERGQDENPVTIALREHAEARLLPQIQLTDDRLIKALQGQPEDLEIFPYRP
ncbi:MAG: DNA-directed RNA polymerase subunit omega [Armatimonadetes bacterium]|nr:DNA-directed RNA polymerase subunit omega [Armatimonadota bacterium]MDW8122777.1 DNA-directed RNA polymerase subunit omega [Armatimonadota bacterium]